MATSVVEALPSYENAISFPPDYAIIRLQTRKPSVCSNARVSRRQVQTLVASSSSHHSENHDSRRAERRTQVSANSAESDISGHSNKFPDDPPSTLGGQSSLVGRKIGRKLSRGWEKVKSKFPAQIQRQNAHQDIASEVQRRRLVETLQFFGWVTFVGLVYAVVIISLISIVIIL